jgi:hypothetical protein
MKAPMSAVPQTVDEGVISSFPPRPVVITALGITQILAWGSTYYLPAVLAKPIADDMGWPLTYVVGGLTIGLLAASFVSPRVGRAIQATGGRPVLAFSSLLMAAGLLALAFVESLPVYFLIWTVLGFGMGAGLYDAAFATLGRLYGSEARSAITTLTLFGGFASTLCWPLSALLVENFGWRGACLTYAGVHLFINLPLHRFLLPRMNGGAIPLASLLRGRGGGVSAPLSPNNRLTFMLLAAGLTVGGIGSAILSVHLLTILQARDITLAAAVAFGALVGPSQVAARVLEMLIGRRYHPIWTAAASVFLTMAGIVILALGLPVIAFALILYGGGIGIRSIVRGTLPLALFGPQDYAALMGRLALPILMVGALSPLAAAYVLDYAGPDVLLAFMVGLCIMDALLLGAIAWAAARKEPAAS